MPEITRLANGVRILSETMPHVRSVSIGIWVKTGSRQDPAAHLGMAHFVEHMLFKGTTRRDALQIAKDIDALGGVLNAQTAKEYTVYYVKVLDESLNKAADVLFDLFLNSLIDPEELEKEKRVVLQEIGMTEDTPDDYINDLFAAAFFQNSPLGTSILGNAETVGAIRRDDILGFMKDSYDAGSIVISGVGNLEHQQLVDLAAPHFEGLPRFKRDSAITKPTLASKRAIHVKDLEQIHFTLGTLGPAMRDETRWTYIVLNALLGGSMSSMLFQEAREKLGLVYSIYSYLSAYLDCGVMAIYAATTPENIIKTVEVVGAQFKRIKRGDLGDMKLDEVKALIRGNLLLARESTENRMSSIAKNELYYERDVPIEEVLRKINAVSAEAILELAHTIFVDDKMTLVSLGKDHLENFDLAAVL
jgi:predicted Zn-dependent peptidase